MPRFRLASAVPPRLAHVVALSAALPTLAFAQSAPSDATLDTIHVTGSRIRQTNTVTAQPVTTLDRAQIEATGAQSLGELLQQLPASGRALNTKFNASGNFGYPPDGGGIGAGSSQVDLRHLGAQRVLVLVDGVRWVNESSASGVSGSADLNTIPLAIVDRIEVLEDGASAIYGSDAIAGVVNIITRRGFKGGDLHAGRGAYARGGGTDAFSAIFGTGGAHWSGTFGASGFRQRAIGSDAWSRSREPEPGAGLAAGSSGTPQGVFVFCDPARAPGTPGGCADATHAAQPYRLTLNGGTTSPLYVSGNPSAGSYHDVAASDRFDFAPYNLLLTPSERKSLYASVQIELDEDVRLHFKALFNSRASENRAAPEPIFVGPGAGTGGIADGISIPANHPFNPFGFALNANSNFVMIGRRPLEVGPRVFAQQVDTWHVDGGIEGLFEAGERVYAWDFTAAHAVNAATQRFRNGLDIAHIRTALGDPAVCAATSGCTPLDLFGGQARPMTRAMIGWIVADQRDASTQTLDLASFNITGDLFRIGNRSAGFAAGAESRRYRGDFRPDPRRTSGASQDAFAAPVSAGYDVHELYAEANLPVLRTLDLVAAGRWSDYSTFGSATTGKLGFRWQPVDELVIRGTRSTGFRAPNLGELHGLTQFGATLVDLCGSTGHPGPSRPDYATGCAAQGAPANFEQANTQITTFTGGNPRLQPETADSWTLGAVYSPAWAEQAGWSRRLDVSLNYYDHRIDGAIQAQDLQSLLAACLRAGGTPARSSACRPFVRQSNGNLQPPNNFLQNFGAVNTRGADLKIDWAGPERGFGALTASLQATWVRDYVAVDGDGHRAPRRVGVEVGDGAIPRWQANVRAGWRRGDLELGYGLRYIDAVEEDCSTAVVANVPGCLNARHRNRLGATTYHDLQLVWRRAFGRDGLALTAGANNAFGKSPPVCVTCTLNGYDAGTYDLPGAFWYLDADYRF